MNLENEIKDLIQQNGYLIFEKEKLVAINEQLMNQIEILKNIIENILNKKGDKDE